MDFSHVRMARPQAPPRLTAEPCKGRPTVLGFAQTTIRTTHIFGFEALTITSIAPVTY